MKARRSHVANAVFVLEGGNEDNDLWVEKAVTQDQQPCIASVWEPTPEERQAIAAGQNIELIVFGTMQPPVAMQVTDVKLGKPPEATPAPPW